MSHRIDSQMLQIHQRCTQGSSDGGKKISDTEALQLIRRAHEINETHSSSFSSSDSRKGNKYLLRLMSQHKSDFSDDSKQIIEKYIRTGRVPSQVGSGDGVSGHGHGGVHGGGFLGHGGGVPSHGGGVSNSGGRVPSHGGGTPSHGGGVPNSGGGVPSHGGGVPNSGGRVPSHGGGTPSHGGGVPNSGGGVPSHGGGVSNSGGRVPSHGGGTPSHGGGVPNSGGGVPSHGGGVPNSGGGVPSHGGGVPNSGGGVPSHGGGVPNSGGGVPSHGGGVPNSGGGTPSHGGGVPNSGGGVPSHGGGVPNSGGGVPSHGGGVPNSGGGTPSNGGGLPGAGGPSHPSDPGRPSSGGSIVPPSTSPVGGSTGTVGPNGTVILDFQAKKTTWGCHWFPMQETQPGGDATNNLYAKGGPLDKLDKLTGGTARQYEWDHNRKAVDAGKEFGWWGHCNNASEAACILPEPKRPVVMTAPNGEQVKFTRNDIQGLLVKCTPSLVTRVDFKGERFNNASRDNPNDPAPTLFLEVMKEWSQEGIPFVLDIDRNEQVWNFPYDRVKISESNTVPQGVNGVPAGAKYYHIDMSGTGFPEKARVYECWVASDGTSGWVKTPNTHNNPDFMWRPHAVGDIMDKSTWQARGRTTNPQVDLQMVYEIYMKSLA